MSRRVIEITSTGVDEWLQGIGGDPYGGSSAMGLRVPTLATVDSSHRYLFNLASFSIPQNTKARIVGYRQFASLGMVTTAPGSESPGRYVEQEITTPNFRLPDGNISWHLQRLGPPNNGGFPQGDQANATDLRSFKKYSSVASALLYQAYAIPAGNAYYVNLTAYTPPNNGRPHGTPLRAGTQGTFYDLRTEWRTHGAWNALDMELEGPDTITLFASVFQSAGASGVGALSAIPQGMPEEQFLAAFPGAIYWRVGGALMLEVSP